MHLERFYTSVYDQCSSPCGKFLACCNNFGRVSIFNLEEAVTTTNKTQKPYFTFKIGKSAYCLITCEDLLVCGLEDGEVKMFKWTDLTKKISTATHSLSSLSDKQAQHHAQAAGVGSMCVVESTLYTSHHSSIHRWDCNNNFRHVDSFNGHSDYIYSMQTCRNLVHSASEDGSVITWDSRSGDKANTLIPTSDQACHLPSSHSTPTASSSPGGEGGGTGKWVKSVAVANDKDYLVVGGGFKMSLWYPGYKTATTIFTHAIDTQQPQHSSGSNGDANGDCEMESDEKETGDVRVGGDGSADGKCLHDVDPLSKGITNHILIHNGAILSCGDSRQVSTWATNGCLLSSLPCTPFNLYHLHVNHAIPRLLTIAGSSHVIDACINYNYKSFSFAMV